MKLSEKILALIKGAIQENRDWDWVKDNTVFVEWYHDAQELEKYIEAMQPPWINTQDRLPTPEDGEVLVHAEGFGFSAAYIRRDPFDQTGFSKEQFCAAFDVWMPIPPVESKS